MIAYKFLDTDRQAPFTGVRWPEPGTWLESERVELCVSGVHACRVGDLPYWLRAELWEVELEDDVIEGERLIAARRGRLVRRIETWNDAAAKAFGRSCAEEARRRAAGSPDLAEYAADAEGTAEHSPQFAAFASARLAELQDGTAGYESERERQARWLAAELGLA
ncbi:MAG: hypothetical protein ACM3QU_12385 [Verrucomicrobiota bacterium]